MRDKKFWRESNFLMALKNILGYGKRLAFYYAKCNSRKIVIGNYDVMF